MWSQRKYQHDLDHFPIGLGLVPREGVAQGASMQTFQAAVCGYALGTGGSEMTFPEGLQEFVATSINQGVPVGQIVLSMELVTLELKIQMLQGTAPQPEPEPLIKPATNIPR